MYQSLYWPNETSLCQGCHCIIVSLLLRCGGETLWREVGVVQHWLVPGQLVKGEGQLAHMHCGPAIGGPWGTLHHIVCHTVPQAKHDRSWDGM